MSFLAIPWVPLTLIDTFRYVTQSLSGDFMMEITDIIINSGQFIQMFVQLDDGIGPSGSGLCQIASFTSIQPIRD